MTASLAWRCGRARPLLSAAEARVLPDLLTQLWSLMNEAPPTQATGSAVLLPLLLPRSPGVQAVARSELLGLSAASVSGPSQHPPLSTESSWSKKAHLLRLLGTQL